MKARHEFQTDKDYETYLVVYFSSLLLPQILNHEYGNEEHATEYSIKVAQTMMIKFGENGY